MTDAHRAIFLTFSGILGLVIGSFLNVCIFRLPRNCMSVVKPSRSRCPKCLAWIAWYDNLPVVSWLALGRKCRHCKEPISPRYALVELLTGALLLYAGWRALYGVASPSWAEAVRFGVEAWFIASLIACTFIDVDFRILPDEITLSGIVVGLAAAAVFPFLHAEGFPWERWFPEYTLKNPHFKAATEAALGAVCGAGAIQLAGWFGKLLFRKEAMGFGDVKYMAMIGAVLGWRSALLSILVACLAGSLFGIGKFIAVRRMGYVPFGPFLSLGALFMLFWTPLVGAALKAYMNFTSRLIDR